MRVFCHIKNLLLFLLFSSFSNVIADPVITNISGSRIDGEIVSISGTGFGVKGPTIHIYDNFDDGTVGEPVNLEAVVGNWFAYLNAFPPISDNISYSGNLSMRAHMGEAHYLQRTLIAEFLPTTEFFLSYWFQVPVGHTFPGASILDKIPTTATLLPGSNTSTAKFAWIGDGEPGSNNDVMLPAVVNGGLILGGNDTSNMGKNIIYRGPGPIDFEQVNSLFRFGQWVRFTYWLKAGPDPTGPGDTRQTYDIPDSAIHLKELSTNPVFTGVKTPYQWTNMNFVGYLGGGDPDWSLTRPLFDDFYLATGAGAQARIELCDSPSYVNCTKFGYITIDPANVGTEWTDTVITGTIRKGALTDSDIENGAFVYVFDENNLVNPIGYPICAACPLPPTNLQAN